MCVCVNINDVIYAWILRTLESTLKHKNQRASVLYLQSRGGAVWGCSCAALFSRFPRVGSVSARDFLLDISLFETEKKSHNFLFESLPLSLLFKTELVKSIQTVGPGFIKDFYQTSSTNM